MHTNTALRALAATAALALSVAIAAPASAATPVVSLSSFGDPATLPGGQQLIANFNDAGNPTGVLLPGFSLTLNGSTVGFNEGGSGYSGTLFNDPTHYLTVPGGASTTLTSVNGLTSMSIYMGSPDTYNYIHFVGAGYDHTLSGTDLVLGDTNQSWNWGKRVNFDFGGARVTSVTFSSTGNSFELDNVAGGGVPEPATWGLMIMGFGGMGALFRRRRAAATFA